MWSATAALSWESLQLSLVISATSERLYRERHDQANDLHSLSGKALGSFRAATIDANSSLNIYNCLI